MTEEAMAQTESVEPTDSGESFDMEGAINGLSEDLFGKSEEPEVETEVEVKAEEKAEEKAEPKTEPKTEEPKEEKPQKEAPQSWRKEMREFYNAADPILQDYIMQREDQMKEGLEKDRGDSNLGRTMRDMMTPYEAVLKQQGLDPVSAVKGLLNVHYSLSNGTPEQKQAALQRLAQNYRIGEAQGDPRVMSLEQELAQIKQNLNASHEKTVQETRTRIETEVQTFAQEHPLFDDLEDDIAALIKGGGYNLEEAYEKALWANPTTRQKELDRIDGEKQAEAERKAKEESEKVKKAKSINVRGRDTNRAPTAPKGTMEDTLHDVYREIQSR